MIARNNTFVYDAYEEDQYYRLRLSEDGSVVQTESVSMDHVVNVTV